MSGVLWPTVKQAIVGVQSMTWVSSSGAPEPPTQDSPNMFADIGFFDGTAASLRTCADAFLRHLKLHSLDHLSHQGKCDLQLGVGHPKL
jgi:hypothetical protein